jgi:hypothetical protein
MKTLLLLLVSNIAIAQGGLTLIKDIPIKYEDCYVQPTFLSDVKFQKYVSEKIAEPLYADGVSGEVKINFIIEREGIISNITISGIETPEDVNFIKKRLNLCKWSPAENNEGEKVRVKYCLTLKL